MSLLRWARGHDARCASSSSIRRCAIVIVTGRSAAPVNTSTPIISAASRTRTGPIVSESAGLEGQDLLPAGVGPEHRAGTPAGVAAGVGMGAEQRWAVRHDRLSLRSVSRSSSWMRWDSRQASESMCLSIPPHTRSATRLRPTWRRVSPSTTWQANPKARPRWTRTRQHLCQGPQAGLGDGAGNA